MLLFLFNKGTAVNRGFRVLPVIGMALLGTVAVAVVMFSYLVFTATPGEKHHWREDGIDVEE